MRDLLCDLQIWAAPCSNIVQHWPIQPKVLKTRRWQWNKEKTDSEQWKGQTVPSVCISHDSPYCNYGESSGENNVKIYSLQLCSGEESLKY